ncbi:MAG: transferase, partial [Candidatus Omnitrophota bacterium]
MYILFPGRHHLLTSFQFDYLKQVIAVQFEGAVDVDGKPFQKMEVSGLIFAVTSANHSNTRRNPLPFYLRAMGLQVFSAGLGVPSYIYGVDDVGHLDNFARYTIKKIRHESDECFDLSPKNAVVLCSTPVLEMYARLGFRILPAELGDRATYKMKTENPWDLVERIARSADWEKDQVLAAKIHPASASIWQEYRLGQKAKMLFSDRMIGDDGDITSTRDYNSYVRQMDEIAGLKYEDTASFIQSGRVGDIGCSAGSWIKLACQDVRFRESDFYGIEVARHLYDLCLQRKHNGDFNSPFVFFSKKNAVMDLVFDEGSMNTIHTSSLTHEIVSYGSQADLLQFISNRYRELVPGGVWINRDVVGPEEKDSMVLMRLCKNDGRSDNYEQAIEDRSELATYLKGLSTF